MKFRNKTVVLEAIQFLGDAESIAKIRNFYGKDLVVDYADEAAPVIHIEYADGIMPLRVGHWIVKDAEGVFCVYVNGLLQENYEPVE